MFKGGGTSLEEESADVNAGITVIQVLCGWG